MGRLSSYLLNDDFWWRLLVQLGCSSSLMPPAESLPEEQGCLQGGALEQEKPKSRSAADDDHQEGGRHVGQRQPSLAGLLLAHLRKREPLSSRYRGIMSSYHISCISKT